MQRDVTIVLGKTGFGKSWWAKLYARRVRRLFVYDPLMSPEYAVAFVDSSDQLEDVMETQSQGRGLRVFEDDGPDTYEARTVPGQTKGGYRVGLYDRDELDAMIHFAYAYGDMLAVIEEASTVFEKGQARLTPAWRNAIFLGRHRALSLCLVAQRAMSIPIDLRSQANRIISFQQHEGDDLGWIEDFYGKEATDSIASLPKFTCLDYYNGELGSYSIRPDVARVFGIQLNTEPSQGSLVGMF